MDLQLLSASLEDIDPTVYDIIEKVRLVAYSPQA